MYELRKFFLEEWYFAFPMLGMSMVAMALLIWRIMLNYKAATNLNQFLPAFQDILAKEGTAGALRYCQAQSGLIPRRLFVVGLESSRQGLAAMRRAMANVAELEIVPQLNFLLPTILAIGKIATMVGLFGTVVSMIKTFGKIQELKESGGNMAEQSGAIGLALFATAFGLVTAIPLVFAHVQFKAWIASYETKMKYAAQKLIALMQAAKANPAPARAAQATRPAGSAAPQR